MRTLRFYTCIILVALLASIAGCGGESTLELTPPGLATVSPGTAKFGDTLVVTGSGFASNPRDNQIVISPGRFADPVARRVIVPFSGSRTTLRGIVPDGAFTGSVRVEQADPLGGAFAFGVKPPEVASSTKPLGVRLLEGNVGKSFFSGSSYDFSVGTAEAEEDYVVVVFSNAVPPSNTWTYLYDVTAQSAAAAVPAASVGKPPAKSRAEGPSLRDLMTQDLGVGRIDIHPRVDGQIADLLKRGGGVRSSGSRGAVRSTISGGSAPETVTFNILTTATGNILDPANFKTVDADLKYTGDHTLLYVDVETPALFLSDADAQNLGQLYDQSIYGTDRLNFGNESDINHDGKVAILLSPVVNRMTPLGKATEEGFIAGFFLLNDLLPNLVDSRTTNGMEIFYGMVPDPTAQFGNEFPIDQTLPVIEGVLAHEFVHMILFNYRVLIYGQGIYADYMEEIWMNEGLAHIAEDLNGFDKQNTDRANLFLDNPGDATLIYGGDALNERGADFLFLRLLGDRFTDGIYKKLVQTKKVGTANVEAQTGVYFNELFADWSAALYLSGKGITSDARFNYTSLDINKLGTSFHALNVSPVPVGARSEGFIKSMAPKYLFYTLLASSTVDFAVGADAAGRMNAIVVRTR